MKLYIWEDKILIIFIFLYGLAIISKVIAPYVRKWYHITLLTLCIFFLINGTRSQSLLLLLSFLYCAAACISSTLFLLGSVQYVTKLWHMSGFSNVMFCLCTVYRFQSNSYLNYTLITNLLYVAVYGESTAQVHLNKYDISYSAWFCIYKFALLCSSH